MSKRQQAIKLVEELLELKAKTEQKEAELDALFGTRSMVKAKAKAKAPAKAKKAKKKHPHGQVLVRDTLLDYMGKREGRSITSADALEDLGCSAQSFG
ncbi:hypothetical protein LCGC14_2045200, partial [marine sediment metagenome]